MLASALKLKKGKKMQTGDSHISLANRNGSAKRKTKFKKRSPQHTQSPWKRHPGPRVRLVLRPEGSCCAGAVSPTWGRTRLPGEGSACCWPGTRGEPCAKAHGRGQVQTGQTSQCWAWDKAAHSPPPAPPPPPSPGCRSQAHLRQG